MALSDSCKNAVSIVVIAKNRIIFLACKQQTVIYTNAELQQGKFPLSKFMFYNEGSDKLSYEKVKD